MKKLHIYFAGLVLMLMTACSLDEKILDTPGPQNVNTDEELQPLINGLYSRFNDAAAFKYRGWLMLVLAADDFYSTSGSDYGPIANRTYTSSHVVGFYNNLYMSIGAANQLIGILDKAVEEGTVLSPELVERAYGEAYFVRAFSYYYLVRLYGGVPLRLEPVNADSELYLPRATIHEVYDQIFIDFKAAYPRLPLASELAPAELGRATRGAAQAIMAQAYLTYGNQRSLRGMGATEQYENAVVFADSVMNSGEYQLLNNYADLFDVEKEVQAYREVIFGIRFAADPQASQLPSAGSEYAFRFGVSNINDVTGNKPRGNGTGDVIPSHAFVDRYIWGTGKDDEDIPGDALKYWATPPASSNNYNEFVSKNRTHEQDYDYRLEVSFTRRGNNRIDNVTVVPYPFIRSNVASHRERALTRPVLSKYWDPNGRDRRNHNNDFFVIRYAEIYLILCEALNELHGDWTHVHTNEAHGSQTLVWFFNRLRTRAQQADGTSRSLPLTRNGSHLPNMTKESFRLRIFHERGLELCGEGQRWFDLVRVQHPTNPTKTMYEYMLTHELRKSKYTTSAPTFSTDTYTWSNLNYVYQPMLDVQLPKHLLFPIPAEEYARNPNFGEQNPGW